jgi:hypothetical protein
MSYNWGRTMSEDTDKPYAWEDVNGTIWNHKTSEDDVPLYTKPQWQGLTDEERAEIAKSDPYRPTEMMKLAEAKLKEKNT